MAACAKKKILAKRFAQTISVHYWDFECTYVYWIWLRDSVSYVVILNEQVSQRTRQDNFILPG